MDFCPQSFYRLCCWRGRSCIQQTLFTIVLHLLRACGSYTLALLHHTQTSEHVRLVMAACWPPAYAWPPRMRCSSVHPQVYYATCFKWISARSSSKRFRCNTWRTVLRCVFVLFCQQHELCLLPAVKAQDQGKICVVIDLDETLVHSSFKVQHLFLTSSRPSTHLHPGVSSCPVTWAQIRRCYLLTGSDLTGVCCVTCSRLPGYIKQCECPQWSCSTNFIILSKAFYWVLRIKVGQA